MSSSHLRSLGLVAALAVAAGSAFVHCAAPTEEDEDLTEDQITGVNNALGLGLRYEEKSGRVQATLSGGLKEDEKLFIRVRRGKMTLTSQKDLDCSALTQARPLAGSGERELTGKIVYQGPKVEKSIFDLANLYDDPNWATGDVPQSVKDDIKKFGPDPIVEACVVKGGKVRAKLSDEPRLRLGPGHEGRAHALEAQREPPLRGRRRGPLGTATATRIDPRGRTTPARSTPRRRGGRALNETNVTSQIEYGELCVQELGEIPFFKKRGDGQVRHVRLPRPRRHGRRHPDRPHRRRRRRDDPRHRRRRRAGQVQPRPGARPRRRETTAAWTRPTTACSSRPARRSPARWSSPRRTTRARTGCSSAARSPTTATA